MPSRMWIRTREWEENLCEHECSHDPFEGKKGEQQNRKRRFQESRLQKTQDNGRSHVVEEKCKGIKELRLPDEKHAIQNLMIPMQGKNSST